MLLAMGVGDRGGGQSARPQQSDFDAQENVLVSTQESTPLSHLMVTRIG